jgi:hypothetical protein
MPIEQLGERNRRRFKAVPDPLIGGEPPRLSRVLLRFLPESLRDAVRDIPAVGGAANHEIAFNISPPSQTAISQQAEHKPVRTNIDVGYVVDDGRE